MTYGEQSTGLCRSKGPPYPSVREEGTPWTKHVWKVTATGEELADYCIPTDRDERPDPDIVLGFLIDDGEGREYAQKVWRLRKDL